MRDVAVLAAHDRTRVRERCEQHRPQGVHPGQARGGHTAVDRGNVGALRVGGGTLGGSHWGHTAKSARFWNKRGE